MWLFVRFGVEGDVVVDVGYDVGSELWTLLKRGGKESVCSMA